MGTYGVSEIEWLMKDLIQAPEQRLTFTCPECGRHELQEISEEVISLEYIVSRLVRKDNGRRFWDHDSIDYEEYSGHFQCRGCGHILEDDYGNRIIVFEELADWLIKNCEQETQIS